MPKIVTYIFVLIALFQVSTTVSAVADEITLVADPWCPYNCEPGSASPGILIEVAQRAFAKSGHTVVYKTLPWERAIRAVRNGKYDGIVGSGLQETPDFVFTKEEILTVNHTFFVRKGDKWNYRDLNSLADRKVAVIQSYSHGDFDLNYVQPNADDPNKILLVAGDTPLKRLLKLLNIGRVDTLIEDKNVFNYTLNGQPGFNNIRPAGIYSKEKIFIAFSPAKKNSEALAKTLGDFISKNKETVIADIIAKYVR